MKENEKAFMLELAVISAKHGIKIAVNGCGCCGETDLDDVKEGDAYFIHGDGYNLRNERPDSGGEGHVEFPIGGGS